MKDRHKRASIRVTGRLPWQSLERRFNEIQGKLLVFINDVFNEVGLADCEVGHEEMGKAEETENSLLPFEYRVEELVAGSIDALTKRSTAWSGR